MSSDVRRAIRSPEFRAESRRTATCAAAADVAGSRLSKVFAILHMLSQDLKEKVLIADEAYNMYKNMKLVPEDEAVLVLCSYYLTLKLNEAWLETHMQSPGLLQTDEQILEEFLHIGRGWAKEIKQLQENVIQEDRTKSSAEERSLYDLLGRVRLNEALDALRAVRCVSRCADRSAITHALLHDAVRAHHRRALRSESLGAPVIRTYGPMLDDHNITGQNVKVFSIRPNST